MAWLYITVFLQIIAGSVVLASFRRHLRTTQPPKLDLPAVNQNLPTLSVCIPARNETVELQDCLDSLVRSTYPKLEILVLDDQSQDRRTPEIIRQFAHDGVIFVGGKTPPHSWLAKNYAYDQLADAANGEILLFCGVDIRFEPNSLANLVRALQQKQKQMISLLPVNELREPSRLKSWLIQPARYAWELALPRRLLRRPPVLSSCWLINRQALLKAGGFDAVKQKIVPESYFARETAHQSDGYSFMVADDQVPVKSVKSFAEQRETAVRVRFPQLHRRPLMVFLTSLAELMLLVLPGLIAIGALATQHFWLALLAGLAYWLQAWTYSQCISLTYRRGSVAGLVMLPIAAAYDIWLLNYSMWQYLFGQVRWKGRDVTNRHTNLGSAQKQ